MDQRVTLLLGYLPQELNGTSLYEHIQYDDIPAISECHRNALKSPQEVNIPHMHCSDHHQQVQSPFFRFRAKDGKFVKLESKWKQFRNPWTKEIEYLICKNHMLITRLNILTTTTIIILIYNHNHHHYKNTRIIITPLITPDITISDANYVVPNA